MSATQTWWRLVRMILTALIVAYVGLVLLALLAANGMIHHPEATSRRAPAAMRQIRGPDGTDVAVLHLPHPRARFTVWFFHGNAEDLGDIEPFLHQLHGRGFAVFAADYPGYGHSGGRPTEATVYAAARTAREHLRRELRVPAAQTLLMGRSLGSGPAVQMATEENVAGLVIQSGFMSAFRVLTRWRLLPWDQFDNLAKLARVRCPVLVMHGRADEVISFAHGERLYAAAAEPKRRLWIAGAHHNDFLEMAGDAFWSALREFSELCARAGGASP